MTKTKKVMDGVWNSISYTFGSDTTTGNIPPNTADYFTVRATEFGKEINTVHETFKATEKEVNQGRKRLRCNQCGNGFFTDEGIDDKFCGLDCKYNMCVIAEVESEDENGSKL